VTRQTAPETDKTDRETDRQAGEWANGWMDRYKRQKYHNSV